MLERNFLNWLEGTTGIDRRVFMDMAERDSDAWDELRKMRLPELKEWAQEMLILEPKIAHKKSGHWQEMSDEEKDAADLAHILAHPEQYQDDGEEIEPPLPAFIATDRDRSLAASWGILV